MARKTLRVAAIAAILGFLILLLQALNVISPPTNWMQFLRDLAFSLILAAILLATVEFFTKNELLQDIRSFLTDGAETIRQAEFAKTLSDRITPDIFNQVDQFIIKSPYLLKDMKVNLEFQTSDREYLKLIDTTFFKVTNLTTALIRDEIPAYETSELSSEYPEYPIVTNVEIDGQKKLDEIRSTGKIARSGSRLTVCLPIVLPSQGTVEILFTTEKYVRCSDSDIWNVTHKTTNLSISCTGPEDLEVRAYPIHPDAKYFKPMLGSQGKLKRWDIECGILPFQGIQLWWKQSNQQSKADL
jgi:hypothetical protein